jgi:hypothetical protein
MQKKYTFMYLYLHSLELLIIIWLAVAIFGLGRFWIAFAIGLTQHIFFDICFNPIYPSSYFISCRFLKGFKKRYLLREDQPLQKG